MRETDDNEGWPRVGQSPRRSALRTSSTASLILVPGTLLELEVWKGNLKVFLVLLHSQEAVHHKLCSRVNVHIDKPHVVAFHVRPECRLDAIHQTFHVHAQ